MKKIYLIVYILNCFIEKIIMANNPLNPIKACDT